VYTTLDLPLEIGRFPKLKLVICARRGLVVGERVETLMRVRAGI
jgi:hypothetical protein